MGERGYRLSGGEKQRIAHRAPPAQGAAGRRARRGDRAPRRRERGRRPARARRDARGSHLDRDRAPAVHDPQRRRDPRRRATARSSTAARTTSCSRAAGCTATSTRPSSRPRSPAGRRGAPRRARDGVDPARLPREPVPLAVRRGDAHARARGRRGRRPRSPRRAWRSWRARSPPRTSSRSRSCAGSTCAPTSPSAFTAELARRRRTSCSR